MATRKTSPAPKLNDTTYSLKAYVSMVPGGTGGYLVRTKKGVRAPVHAVASLAALAKLAVAERLLLQPLPRDVLEKTPEHWVPKADWVRLLRTLATGYVKRNGSPKSDALVSFSFRESLGAGVEITGLESMLQKMEGQRMRRAKPRPEAAPKSGAKAGSARSGTRAQASSR